MKAFLLSALLVIPDGGADAPRVGYAPEVAALSLADGGVVQVTRGCWFDSATCVDLARERVACEERVRLAEAKDVKTPAPDLALAFGLGTLAGALTAIAIGLAAWAVTQPRPGTGAGQ